MTANSKVIKAEAKEGHRKTLGLGYTYSLDNRRTGLDPKAGMFLRLSQDFDLTGDTRFVRTNVKLGGETYVSNENFKVTATLDGGALNFHQWQFKPRHGSFFPWFWLISRLCARRSWPT